MQSDILLRLKTREMNPVFFSCRHTIACTTAKTSKNNQKMTRTFVLHIHKRGTRTRNIHSFFVVAIYIVYIYLTISNHTIEFSSLVYESEAEKKHIKHQCISWANAYKNRMRSLKALKMYPNNRNRSAEKKITITTKCR